MSNQHLNLVAKDNKAFVKTTDSNHNKHVVPNILKQNCYAENKHTKMCNRYYLHTDSIRLVTYALWWICTP